MKVHFNEIIIIMIIFIIIIIIIIILYSIILHSHEQIDNILPLNIHL